MQDGEERKEGPGWPPAQCGGRGALLDWSGELEAEPLSFIPRARVGWEYKMQGGLKELKTGVQTKPSMCMLTAALVAVTKSVPWADRMDQIRNGDGSAMKSGEALTQAATWMNLGNIKLSKRSLTQKVSNL